MTTTVSIAQPPTTSAGVANQTDLESATGRAAAKPRRSHALAAKPGGVARGLAARACFH